MGKGGGMQEAADRQTQANRPDQSTPYASSQWTQSQLPAGAQTYNHDGNNFYKDPSSGQWQRYDPSTIGKWSQKTQLDPQLQGSLFNLENQWQDATKNPLDNGKDARQHAEDNLYQRETSRLDPQWQQQQDAFKNELLNQGFTPGTQAYDNAYGNFARSKNDAYSTARNDAISMGGAEATRQQQMDLLQRMAPLMGMQGLQQLMQMPGVAPPGDYVGAQKSANDFAGAMAGGLFNLGGNLGAAAVMA